jgi:Family of unknown function (DUF5335)
MSNLKDLPSAQWRPFFDQMSKAVIGKRAEIEVASLDLGDQILAEWVPLLGITYDARNDSLDVLLDSGTHQILHPRRIVVEEGAGGLASIAAVDKDGEEQVVRLKDPLMLP